MIKTEYIYWIALSHLPRWKNERINNLLIDIIYNRKISLEEFFNYSPVKMMEFGLTTKEINDIGEARVDLPNISFLTEDLLSQGFEMITINSDDYSKTLKNNLKRKYSPPLLYVKGNKQILHEKSVAIVGSRDAGEISLEFTDKIAKKASETFKVVVSGFAKGVDKQALDSAIKYRGQSIIVLPQGILTYSSGIKKYYKQITEGNVLVLSVFHPKAVWNVGLAMARNPIIYGLADEIYVAQSSDKGGTWSGVKDGLRKGRKIFVRKPDEDEMNANMVLIEKGGIAVDINGENVEPVYKVAEPISAEGKEDQKEIHDIKEDNTEAKIFLELARKTLTAKQLISSLNLNWSTQKLIKYLKSNEEIEVVKGNPLKFRKKIDTDGLSLFN